MNEMTMKVNIGLSVSLETADMCVNLLNIFLEDNPEFEPERVLHQYDDQKDYWSVVLKESEE